MLDYSKTEIKQIFEILSDESAYPLMLHCTQGKDRTGLIVILVLLLLEVPVSSVSADYLASERELEVEREERVKEMKSIGLGDEFAKCPIGFVPSIYDYLQQKYKGVREYLASCDVAPATVGKVTAILSAK